MTRSTLSPLEQTCNLMNIQTKTLRTCWVSVHGFGAMGRAFIGMPTWHISFVSRCPLNIVLVIIGDSWFLQPSTDQKLELFYVKAGPQSAVTILS